MSDNHQVNDRYRDNNYSKYSPLFGEERLHELIGDTYYAVVDTVEQVNSILYIRFDCIQTKAADAITVDKDSILRFPSIVIELSCDFSQLDGIIRNNRHYLIEGSWVSLKTSLRNTSLNLLQYFNLNRVGTDNTTDAYDVESITFYSDLSAREKTKIKEIIEALSVAPSSEKEVQNFLRQVPKNQIKQVNIYDVGQGNCIGLTYKNNVPYAYFDIGNGCNRNAHTFNAAYRPCLSLSPPIILSHWDQDHYETAMLDSRTWNCKWLAPHQQLTNTAYRLANMLIARGNLTIWPSGLPYCDFGGNRIVKCTSGMAYKNNSGLALFVTYGGGKYVLLPGDATFSKIPHHPTGNIIGMVASHHGSKGAISGMPRSNTPHMLVYSYGAGNHEGHVQGSVRNSYHNHGWVNVRETVKGNIAMVQSPTIFDVPCQPVGCTLQIPVGQHY